MICGPTTRDSAALPGIAWALKRRRPLTGGGAGVAVTNDRRGRLDVGNGIEGLSVVQP
jgi:hypothetical protein